MTHFRAPRFAPWGAPDSIEELAPGIWWVLSAAGAGVMVDAQLAGNLSERARQVGAGPGYSTRRPWSHDWLVFEQNDDLPVLLDEHPALADRLLTFSA